MKKGKLKIGNLAETVTEVAALSIPELATPEILTNPLMLGVKTLQKLAGYFFVKFLNEFRDRLKRKEIKQTSFKSEKPLLSFSEAINIINKGNLDKEKFDALKSIFFSGISTTATERDEFWSYEYLQTLNKISGTEILILRANFQIANKTSKTNTMENIMKNSNSYNRRAWRSFIAKELGLEGFNSLIGKYEQNLEDLGLISPRNYDNRFAGDFEPTKHYRLTEMGYKFCEFMTKYEN